MTAVPLNLPRICASLSGSTVAVNPTIQMLEGYGTACHNDGTENEEAKTAFKRHLVEDGIRVPGESDSNYLN